MALVKAHITIDPKISDDTEARAAMLTQIVRTGDISHINQKRFERYGILTGMIDDSLLNSIRRIPGVQSIDVDKERFL